MKDDIDEKLGQLCTFGNKAKILECLQNGANVNYGHGYAGKVAIINNKLNVLKWLVEYGYDELDEALLTATQSKNHDIMNYLIKQGANVHYAKEICLQKAIEQRNVKSFELLMENKANCHIFNDKFLMILLSDDTLIIHESATRKIFNALLEKINVMTFDAETIFMSHVDEGTFYYKSEDLALNNLDLIIDYVNAKKESINFEKMLNQIEENRRFELENLGMNQEVQELVEEIKPKKKNKI